MERIPSSRPRKPQTQLVWLWFLLTAGLGLVGFLLFIQNANTPMPPSWGSAGGARNGPQQWFSAFQQTLLSPLIASALGALILTRRPGHRIGRLLIALGLVSALGVCTQEWAAYGAYTAASPVPGVELAAWVTNWIWVILFGLLILMAALFPDGRFLSWRWGRLIGASLLLFVLLALIGGMIETPLSSAFQIPNPFFARRPAVYEEIFNISVIFMPVTVLTVLASAVVRFRTSQARERQQMKWLLAGVALMAAFTLVGLGLTFGLGSTLGENLVNAALLWPVLGVGVALLRHRLYDIDVIIRRTLVYGALTALLALAYFGSVVVLQSIVRAATGQRQSELVTVVSTLAIAALFIPLRQRVQDFIDRRFYRKKYDAAKTLAAFSATVRDETDLETLKARLVDVVNETMQPGSVSLWLKPTTDGPFGGQTAEGEKAAGSLPQEVSHGTTNRP
jgi:hypothetical protein